MVDVRSCLEPFDDLDRVPEPGIGVDQHGVAAPLSDGPNGPVAAVALRRRSAHPSNLQS